MRRILWEVTTRCNLRCRHCYLHNELMPPSVEPEGELGTQDCLNIVEQFDKANVLFVDVVGGGEPFVRPDIMIILRHLGEKRFWTEIVTNGTLIDESIARDLANVRIKKIGVSLEGPSPEINDFIRGNGAFRKALRGINYLRDFGIPFRIQMTVNNMNYQILEDMVKFCKELHAEALSLNPYVDCPSTNPFCTSLSLGREEYFLAAKSVSELKEKYSPEFVCSDIDAALVFLSDNPEKASRQKGFHRCICMTTQLTVLYNGNVLPCPLMRDQALGNLMETPLTEVPELPQFKKFKRLYSSSFEEVIEQCRVCEWKSICGGGCRGRAYLASHDYLAPDPQRCLLAKGEFH